MGNNISPIDGARDLQVSLPGLCSIIFKTTYRLRPMVSMLFRDPQAQSIAPSLCLGRYSLRPSGLYIM